MTKPADQQLDEVISPTFKRNLNKNIPTVYSSKWHCLEIIKCTFASYLFVFLFAFIKEANAEGFAKGTNNTVYPQFKLDNRYLTEFPKPSFIDTCLFHVEKIIMPYTLLRCVRIFLKWRRAAKKLREADSKLPNREEYKKRENELLERMSKVPLDAYCYMESELSHLTEDEFKTCITDIDPSIDVSQLSTKEECMTLLGQLSRPLIEAYARCSPQNPPKWDGSALTIDDAKLQFRLSGVYTHSRMEIDTFESYKLRAAGISKLSLVEIH